VPPRSPSPANVILLYGVDPNWEQFEQDRVVRESRRLGVAIRRRGHQVELLEIQGNHLADTLARFDPAEAVVAEETPVAAERVVEWVGEDSASAPNAANEYRTRRARRVSMNVARAVAWRWCAKARPITRRSKAVAPTVSRRTERRASSCQEETEPDRWEQGR